MMTKRFRKSIAFVIKILLKMYKNQSTNQKNKDKPSKVDFSDAKQN